MRFDRIAPGEGVVIYSRVENGKAFLELQFIFEQDDSVQEPNGKYYVKIQIEEKQGRPVFSCHYSIYEEEPAKGMILHPHLWNGIQDPYLYRVKLYLIEESEEKEGKASEGKMADYIECYLALRSLQEIPKKGWFLNGEAFAAHAVYYSLPPQIVQGMSRQERIHRDLLLLQQMGANTLCLTGENFDKEFNQLCEEMGFVIWCGASTSNQGKTEIPTFYGTPEGLFTLHNYFPKDSYYYYKACWSKEPFVYIAEESVKRRENGTFSVKIYSNQKKVALYIEGVLFEFQNGATEYLFEEIPVKKMPLLLTAEAGECGYSITCFKI